MTEEQEILLEQATILNNKYKEITRFLNFSKSKNLRTFSVIVTGINENVSVDISLFIGIMDKINELLEEKSSELETKIMSLIEQFNNPEEG